LPKPQTRTADAIAKEKLRPMNRSYFFERIRHALFGGRLTPSQVDGVRRILDHRDNHYATMSDDQLAYVLATIKWETGHRMTPVREAGGERYLKTKNIIHGSAKGSYR
jgi:putative chitinase